MARHSYLHFLLHGRKSYRIFLAFIWICGLVFGALLSEYAGVSFYSLMRGAVCGSVSIVCLASVSLLPFLFSAYAVYIHSYRFLAVLCFIKGCLFAFVSIGVWIAFESCGWLIRLLCMFSDICCLVPLWWCWLACADCQLRTGLRSIVIGASIAAGIISLDYFFILPFWARLVEF